MKIIPIQNRLFLIAVILSISAQISFGQSKPLSYFLGQAYSHDPQLAASRRNIKIANISRQINQAMFRKPVLSGNGLALWAPGTSNWGFSKAITNGGEYDALLNVTYPIWEGKSLNAYDLESTAQSRQADYNERYRKHVLQMQVTGDYIQVYGDQQHIHYLQNLHNLLKQQITQLRPLVKNGLIRVTDLEQIHLEDSQIRIQISAARSQYSQDQTSMNQICGLPDTAIYQVDMPSLSVVAPSDSLTNINDSRFLQSFSIDSLSLSARQKVTDTQYLPHVNALLNGGLSSDVLNKAYNHFGFTAGIQVSWKFWDGGQKSLQHQQTQLNLENVRDQKNFEKIRLHQRRTSLYKKLTALQGQISGQKEQVIDYRKLLKTYQVEISHGIRPVTDYVTVFRQYLNTQNSLNTLQIQRFQTINELNYWNW